MVDQQQQHPSLRSVKDTKTGPVEMMDPDHPLLPDAVEHPHKPLEMLDLDKHLLPAAVEHPPALPDEVSTMSEELLKQASEYEKAKKRLEEQFHQANMKIDNIFRRKEGQHAESHATTSNTASTTATSRDTLASADAIHKVDVHAHPVLPNAVEDHPDPTPTLVRKVKFGNHRKIEVWDNAIPKSMAIRALNLIQEHGYNYGWHSNKKTGYGHWNRVFGGESMQNREDVIRRLPPAIADVYEHLRNTTLHGNIPLRAYSNAHTYGVEGYPHIDFANNSDTTAILYLNEEWKREWAGETVFFKDDEIEASVLPKFARLVTFTSSIAHVARSLSRICPEARIVLVFKTTLPGE